MKKILVFAALFLVFPVFTYAVSSVMIFGGRVTVIHTPENVLCSSDIEASPFTIMPVGTSSSGPWSKTYGKINIGLVVPNAWILGKYTPSEDCTQYNGTEANPYPTSQTNFYGTSIPKGT